LIKVVLSLLCSSPWKSFSEIYEKTLKTDEIKNEIEIERDKIVLSVTKEKTISSEREFNEKEETRIQVLENDREDDEDEEIRCLMSPSENHLASFDDPPKNATKNKNEFAKNYKEELKIIKVKSSYNIFNLFFSFNLLAIKELGKTSRETDSLQISQYKQTIYYYKQTS
jgi:hypothetical protein